MLREVWSDHVSLLERLHRKETQRDLLRDRQVFRPARPLAKHIFIFSNKLNKNSAIFINLWSGSVKRKSRKKAPRFLTNDHLGEEVMAEFF